MLAILYSIGSLGGRCPSLAVYVAGTGPRARRTPPENVSVGYPLDVVMPLSQRVIVLEYGQKPVEGPPQDIVRNEQVIKAYLGEHRRDRH